MHVGLSIKLEHGKIIAIIGQYDLLVTFTTTTATTTIFLYNRKIVFFSDGIEGQGQMTITNYRISNEI